MEVNGWLMGTNKSCASQIFKRQVANKEIIRKRFKNTKLLKYENLFEEHLKIRQKSLESKLNRWNGYPLSFETRSGKDSSKGKLKYF